jgi:trigger factor
MRWYYSDQQRLAEMEAFVVESNVVEFVLGKARRTRK